jgi:hypothetical protein
MLKNRGMINALNQESNPIFVGQVLHHKGGLVLVDNNTSCRSKKFERIKIEKKCSFLVVLIAIPTEKCYYNKPSIRNH